MSAPLAEVFGSDGPLARAIPGFAVRREQIAMAEHVAAALRSREQLIVEAGTGTGKTFAYLVPALYSGLRVIVSTGTRTLQDQLFHRDLPAVARALGIPVRVALLKGRANYLCMHRLESAEQQAAARGLAREVATALPRVRAWAQITRRGEIAEARHISETHPVWPWVTSTRDNCLGQTCAHFDRCHLVQARREAQAADVIVVNHHLLLADLVLKEEGFGDLLPGADAIIVDEAHQLPDVATQFLGFAVSTRQVQALVQDVGAELLMGGAAVQVSAALVQTIERQLSEMRDAMRFGAQRRELQDWPIALLESADGLRGLLAELADSLAPAQDVPGIAAARRRALELNARMAMLLQNESDSPISVRWAQVSQHALTLNYVPLDVAEQLGSLIEAHTSAWICTSATLAVGEDFAHFASRVGMRAAQAVRFDSPFDYQRQTLLYLPKGLPEPASPAYTQAIIEVALPILRASAGRAFLLFTSHRALQEAAQELFGRLGAELPYPVLVQGDAPREVLLERFRTAGNAVLLGTSSFWEGVDVKGSALSVVIIDKLPFAVPDDPVLKARLQAIERRGGNPFFEEQVPQAVIALKQGVGRLIRDPQDFGVVVLCDPRLRTRGYGRLFLDSLPPMRRAEDLEDVETFLRTRLQQNEHARSAQRSAS